MPSASPTHPRPDPAAWPQFRRARLDAAPGVGVLTSRQDGEVWRWRQEIGLELLQELLARHDQAFASGQALSQGRRGGVSAVSHQGSRYVVKEFRPCRTAWRSPARRAWLASFQLDGLVPACLGWRRESGRELLFFADAGDLSFADEALACRPGAEAAFAEAGRALARLHQRGILHRDGRPGHFLLREAAGLPSVSIIGGEHLRDCGRPLTPAERLAGIGGFLSATDGIRAWPVWRRCLDAWLRGYHAAAWPADQAAALEAFQAQVAATLARTAPPPGHSFPFGPWTPDVSPLASLPRGGECVGCGNCVAACPHQVLALCHDRCGFLLRQTLAASNCRNCGRCLAVCPQLAVSPLPQPLSTPSCYAGRHRDPDVVRRSSSGGAFAALAETFLERDGAAVYGVAMTANQTRYIRICGRDGLGPLHGSKYLPSSIAETTAAVRADLSAGRPVLLTGLPCQIAALKLHLRQEKLPAGQLLLVDLLCHGVPAPRFLAREVARLPAGTEILSFRGKAAPRDSYNLLCRQPDGSLNRRPARKSPAYQGFAAKITLRDSCYHCRYARVPREGDLTLGDFIGHPALKGEAADGLSLILANSDPGLDLLRQSSGRLHLQPATLADAAPGNPRLCNGSHPYERHPLRRFLAPALERWPWWLLTLLYGGGCQRRILGKLPFKLLYHCGKAEYRRTAAALADFTAISVREESAVDLCRQLGRTDAVPVLDPLLLPPPDFHQRLAEAAPAEPAAAGGICAFFLREQPADAALARQAARALSLPVRVVASKCPLFSPLRHDRLTSVPHFVRALRDAALVMTNSFHAVVLSIVFQRPFAYVGIAVHPERAERITSLLHKLGLEGRTLCPGTPVRPDLLETGDLQAATRRLEPLRRQSLDFLATILPN